MTTEPTRARPVTVIGAGHWMLAHDRIGPRVVGMIADRYGPEVEIVDVGTAGLGLLDHVRGQDLMLIVDACLFGGSPGQVREQVPDLDSQPARETSVHQVGPVETLAVAKRLFPDRLPRRILMLLVETEDLTEQAEASACQELVGRIDEEIEAWRRLHKRPVKKEESTT